MRTLNTGSTSFFVDRRTVDRRTEYWPTEIRQTNGQTRVQFNKQKNYKYVANMALQ